MSIKLGRYQNVSNLIRSDEFKWHCSGTVNFATTLQERWFVRGHPRSYVPKNCFYKLYRSDEKAFGEAFYRCSCLAKARGKGYGSLAANNYSGSRVGLKEGFLNISPTLL